MFIDWTLSNEDFGPFLPYIKNDDITDINYNGKELWIDDLNKGCYKVDVQVDDAFLNLFTNKMKNIVSSNFNK